ncbi:hypothetical protein QL285_053432 [Trifolium repens]|nr:hypothetical protein QL285_053432 [Trifolium repens]
MVAGGADMEVGYWCRGGGSGAANSGGGCWWDWRWQSCRLGFGGSCHGGDCEVIYYSRCVGGEEVGLGVVISAVSTSVSELFVLGISSNYVSMEPLWSVITFLQSFSDARF